MVPATLLPSLNHVFGNGESKPIFADYLSKKLEIEVRLKILTRYGNIADNFVSNELDGAFFGSCTYTIARAALDVEIIARPEDDEGVSTYHGLIIVRKDSGIESVKDMQGKTMVFVEKATTAGFLFPVAYLRDNGVENYENIFRETYFSGTHEDSIYDVLNQKADIGAIKNTVFNHFARNDERVRNELVILEKSLNVPENGLAVRAGLDESLKKKLKEALLEMHRDSEGVAAMQSLGKKKFIGTVETDYNNVYKYISRVDSSMLPWLQK